VQQLKHVLYVHEPERLKQLEAELSGAGASPIRTDHEGDSFHWPGEGDDALDVRLHLAAGATEARAFFETGYYNLLVLDSRGAGEAVCSSAEELISTLRRPSDPERAFPLRRILVVLDDCADLADQAFELGKLRVRSFVIDPFGQGKIRQEIARVLSSKKKAGKVALCLAGGGVEGLLFELGVLRALNAYLEHRSITDFDIYCGISAGSILAALIANGVEPREIIHGIEGREGGIAPIGANMIYDFDVSSLTRRLLSLYTQIVSRPTPSHVLSSVLRAVPNGFFRGQRMEEMVERELTRDGRTNNFRQLKKKLYIGATDQDTTDHVVFGTPGHEDVPISKAVRASCGLLPFFGPTEINGRNYVDGQYTRTANFHLAADQGAELILVLDPLIPISIETAGYVARKGGVYGSIQGIKSMIHTRFTNAMAHISEAYPDVKFHVFKPEAEDMRIMSGSPMKYTVRTQIIDLAYRCAVQKIQDRADLLRVHLARHDFVLRRVPRPR